VNQFQYKIFSTKFSAHRINHRKSNLSKLGIQTCKKKN